MARVENREAIAQKQENEDRQTDPRSVRLELGGVCDLNTLDFASLPEPQVSDAADSPGSVSGGIGQGDEPIKDNTSLRADVEVREQSEAAAGSHCVDWQAVFRAASKDGWCVSGYSEREESAAPHEEERVSGTPGTGEDSSVDDGGQD